MRVTFTRRRSVAAAALSVALLSPVALAHGVGPAFADGGSLSLGSARPSAQAMHDRWVFVRDHPGSQAAQRSYTDWHKRSESTLKEEWFTYIDDRIAHFDALLCAEMAAPTTAMPMCPVGPAK